MHQPQDQGEVFMGNILASMAAYVASQERQCISRRTRAKGKELGRPRRLTDGQLAAIRQDLADEMPVAAVAKRYGVPRSTLRGALDRS